MTARVARATAEPRMTLYFAYGSNMSRALMHRHCPLARPLGVAVLDDHRFIMMVDGYASVVAQAGARVHGVLWRLAPTEIAALDAYESIESGLYRRRILPIRCAGRRRSALVYVGHSRRQGCPKPGYLEFVIAAAGDWGLPRPYVETLARWAPARLGTVRRTAAGKVR
jgi:cation transport regulator ChaC